MKTYLSGSNPSIRVPVRDLVLTNGERMRLYDTSGPYTDPDYGVDLKQGLPPLRRRLNNNVRPTLRFAWRWPRPDIFTNS